MRLINTTSKLWIMKLGNQNSYVGCWVFAFLILSTVLYCMKTQMNLAIFCSWVDWCVQKFSAILLKYLTSLNDLILLLGPPKKFNIPPCLKAYFRTYFMYCKSEMGRSLQLFRFQKCAGACNFQIWSTKKYVQKLFDLPACFNF